MSKERVINLITQNDTMTAAAVLADDLGYDYKRASRIIQAYKDGYYSLLETAYSTANVAITSGQNAVANKSNNEIWIKCPHCNARYVVSENDRHLENVEYSCSNCGNSIPVEYFGYCPTCKYVTGQKPEFTQGEGLIYTGKSIVRGYLNPELGLSALETLLDNIPDAKHSGRCHFCNKLYLECPECHRLKKINPDWDVPDIFTCDNCGCRFRHP